MDRRPIIAGTAALALALVGAPVGAEELAENEVRIDLACEAFAVTPGIADTVGVWEEPAMAARTLTIQVTVR